MAQITFYFDLGSPYAYLTAAKSALREATEAAYKRGVFGVPTIAVGDELFWGDDRVEAAAAHSRRDRALR